MSREVMQKALEQIQSVMDMAFHEHYAECCGRGSGGECCGSPVEAWPDWAHNVMDGLADSQRALSAELAKPAAVPNEKRKRPHMDDYEKGCVEGWNDCRDAMLAARPPAPSVDVEAVREIVGDIKFQAYLVSDIGQDTPLLRIADKLARAIGDGA